MTLRILPQARRDIVEAVSYTSEHWGKTASLAFEARLERTLRLIEAKPRAFAVRHDLPVIGLRFVPVEPYVIVYRSEPLEAIRLLHGRRDIPGLLGGAR